MKTQNVKYFQMIIIESFSLQLKIFSIGHYLIFHRTFWVDSFCLLSSGSVTVVIVKLFMGQRNQSAFFLPPACKTLNPVVSQRWSTPTEWMRLVKPALNESLTDLVCLLQLRLTDGFSALPYNSGPNKGSLIYAILCPQKERGTHYSQRNVMLAGS